MKYTNYRYLEHDIEDLLKTKRINVLKHTGRADWGTFMAQVIAWRLSHDPLRYRDYGPYWWAIKKILRQYTYSVGEQHGPEIIEQCYCGAHDEATLLMAELFREDYLRTQFIGTNCFMLNEEGESWECFDEDMETGERLMALASVPAP